MILFEQVNLCIEKSSSCRGRMNYGEMRAGGAEEAGNWIVRVGRRRMLRARDTA